MRPLNLRFCMLFTSLLSIICAPFMVYAAGTLPNGPSPFPVILTQTPYNKKQNDKENLDRTNNRVPDQYSQFCHFGRRLCLRRPAAWVRSPYYITNKITVPTFITGGLHDLFQRVEQLLYEKLKANGVNAKHQPRPLKKNRLLIFAINSLFFNQIEIPGILPSYFNHPYYFVWAAIFLLFIFIAVISFRTK